jgi:hypothetical protein
LDDFNEALKSVERYEGKVALDSGKNSGMER